MIINKLINNEAFYSLIEMFQRENKNVTNKVCNDKFKSFIVESEQYIFTDNLNDINKNILVNESFVGIDTDAKEYIQHHGKKPNGAGKWIFGIGSRNKKDWFSFDGNFTTAKNAAYEEAEKRGKKKIYVMEDFDFKFYDVRFKIIKENNNSHRVSLLVEDKELNVTKTLTENSAKNIGAGWLLDKLIEIDLQEKKMTKKEKEKSEDIVHGMKKKIKAFKDRYGKNAKKVMYATANKLAKESLKEDYKANGIYYHGSPSGDFKGSFYGIHVGTKLAATQALESRIGVPAQGEWDGTREYGKTLLAGKKTLDKLEKERGYYLTTGFNAGFSEGGKRFPIPDEDYYPKSGMAKYSDGTPVSLNSKPKIFAVKINCPMSNTPNNPMTDVRANAQMIVQIKKGQAKRGYFYINNGEDEGSISAVLPPNKECITIINESNMKENLEQKLKLLIEEESFKELSSEPTYRKPYKAVEAEPQFVDGWKIVDNLGQALAGVYKKDEAKTLVDILNSTSEVKTMGYKDLYIKDGEGEKIKDRSLKGVKLKESKSNGLINDIIENEYGTAHGGMQHFSRVNGKEYSWNYVNIKNGRYDVVLNKDKAIGIFYVIGSGETPVGKAKQKKGILKFNNEIEESTKNFKVKFEQKSSDGTQTTTGEKVISAPDSVLARKRVEEDNKDQTGFRVISVEEVR